MIRTVLKAIVFIGLAQYAINALGLIGLVIVIIAVAKWAKKGEIIC